MKISNIKRESHASEKNNWWQTILENFGNSLQIVGESETKISEGYGYHN